MLPEDLVTYAEACNLPPCDPDHPITRDRLRKAVEDDVFRGAVQDEGGRRSWRIPVGDLVAAGFVSTSVYGAGGADTSQLHQTVEQLKDELAELREMVRLQRRMLLQVVDA